MFWAASPSPSQALAPQRSHTHRTGVGAHPRRTRGKPAFIPQAAGVGKGKYSGILDRTATNSRRPACLGSGVAASRELASVSRQRVRSQGPWASAPFGTVTSGAEGRAVGSDAQGFPSRRVLQGRHRTGAPTGWGGGSAEQQLPVTPRPSIGRLCPPAGDTGSPQQRQQPGAFLPLAQTQNRAKKVRGVGARLALHPRRGFPLKQVRQMRWRHWGRCPRPLCACCTR